MAKATTDPTKISSAAKIPPTGSPFTGSSPHGLVDVYHGTLSGDVDAAPASKELLASAPDTGGVANAEHIYNQISALYGGVQLPALKSPSGKSVKSLIFVSGSKEGGYGAFHISSSQTDFDKIVVDSLTSSGSYSSGSGLAGAEVIAPANPKIPRMFPPTSGPEGLFAPTDADAPALKAASAEKLMEALTAVNQNRSALAKYIESHDSGALPMRAPAVAAARISKLKHAELAASLASANRQVDSLATVAAEIAGGRQYLSTALFAAELVESFELLTGRGDSGKTDGEAVSRVVSFKLAPEISLVPGFSSQVAQAWWKDGHPDWVNDNSQNDESDDGNGAGVMFLLFLNDFLGIPLDTILAHMPATGGAPLGQTYAALVKDMPNLAQAAGADGAAAFKAMVALLGRNSQNPDGTLNLPADGNPYPSMPNAKSGGLFAK